jgi:hypothetical protein
VVPFGCVCEVGVLVGSGWVWIVVMLTGLVWVLSAGVIVGLAWMWGGFLTLADPWGTCMCLDWLCGVALVSWGFGMFWVLVVGLGWVCAMVLVVVLGCWFCFLLFACICLFYVLAGHLHLWVFCVCAVGLVGFG